MSRLLLVSIDTLRADRLGLYGRDTTVSPNLDRLARTSAVFDHMVASTPVTLPSHATLFTGLRPIQHGVHDNTTYQLADSHETLAEILAARGFRTGAVVGSLALDGQFGLGQGFEIYDDEIQTSEKSSEGYFAERSATTVTDRSIAIMRDWVDEPFFLFAHYYDPHRTWRAPDDFKQRFSNDGYDAEIAHTDAQVGRLLEALSELGIADSTAVFVTSDHGESLGQFGEVSHAFFIYQATQWVPLLVHVPGMRETLRVSSVAGHTDLLPTALSILGVTDYGNLPGRDLSAHWQPGRAAGPPRHVYAQSLTPTKLGCNPLMAVVGDRWKYLHASRPELFDLDQEPLEQSDHAGEFPERVAAMQEVLDSFLAGRDSATDSQYDVDAATLAGLESLGYLGNAVEDTLEIDPARDDAKDCIQDFTEIGNLILHVRGKDYDAARRVARKLLAVRPELADVYRYLGAVAFAQEQWSEVAAHFRLYLELARASVADAGSADRMGSYTRTHFAEAHHALGIAHGRLGNLELAIAALTEAVDLAPKATAVRYNRGFALMRAGRSDEAIADFRFVLELDPSHVGAAARLYEMNAPAS